GDEGGWLMGRVGDWVLGCGGCLLYARLGVAGLRSVGTYKKLSGVEAAGLCQRAERCTLDFGRAKRWDRRSDCARGGCDDILKVLCSTMSTWIRMGRDAGGRCGWSPLVVMIGDSTQSKGRRVG